MYSVVLAAMLSVGGDTPAWGCHGCSGCWGCHGCSGCHGCWGCHGCSGCHGCWGCHGCRGCSGYAFYGCWGCAGGSGCWGSASGSACWGSAGGGAGSGGYGGYGSYWGCYGGCFGCSGFYGCYGGVAAPAVAMAPAVSYPTAVARAPADSSLAQQTVAERAVVRDALDRVRYQSDARPDAPAPARITVRLPAEAKLWVDGVSCPLTSNTRSFVTPQLQPGQQYAYDMRAEIIRDGQTVTQTQRVVLSAGRQVDVNFGNLTATSVTQR